MRSLKSAFEDRPRPPVLRSENRLAMLAHDIRGALQGVVGGLEAIDATALPLQVQEQLRRISVAARTIEGLTAALGCPVDADCPDAGEDPVVLADFLREVHGRWSAEIAARGRRFDLVVGENLPGVLDIRRLALVRILDNLIANAILHGTGPIRLVAEAATAGGVRFRLAHDGPWIDPAAPHLVTGPNVSELPTDAAGEGLGLQIVRSLADEIGAAVHLGCSDGGVEARLEVAADRVLRDPAPAAAVPPAEEATPPDPDGGAPVVDRSIYDALAEAIGREMMSELLEKVITDLSSSRRNLAASRPALDRVTIRFASHILISVAGAIGATRLQHCARTLNIRAHDTGEEGLAALLDDCIAEIDAAVAYAAARVAAP